MDKERDMYYGNYGYSSGIPMPNQMMPFPNMTPYGMNNMMPYGNQNMMPCNQNNSNNDFENRLDTVEKQIIRLNDRVMRLESMYKNKNNNIYNEPDNSMYMM